MAIIPWRVPPTCALDADQDQRVKSTASSHHGTVFEVPRSVLETVQKAIAATGTGEDHGAGTGS